MSRIENGVERRGRGSRWKVPLVMTRKGEKAKPEPDWWPKGKLTVTRKGGIVERGKSVGAPYRS